MSNKAKELEQRLPPYAPYRSWNNLLIKLREHKPVPKHMDSTFWVHLSFSGSIEYKLKPSLISLGLVDSDGNTSTELSELVDSEGEARKELLNKLLERTYSSLLNQIDLETATTGDLKAYFKSIGADGETGKECQSFFIGLAKDAGRKLHPDLLKRARPARGKKGARKPPSEKPPEDKTGRTKLETDLEKIPGSVPEALASLLKYLPKPGPKWPEKSLWKKAFDANFDLLYPSSEDK